MRGAVLGLFCCFESFLFESLYEGCCFGSLFWSLYLRDAISGLFFSVLV